MPSDRPTARTRLVVLVSGSGTNLQALLDAAADPGFPAEVVAVGADSAGAGGLDRAAAAGLPTFVVPLSDHADRASWDVALADAVAAHGPEWVVCAGFMRILGAGFLDRFPERVINTHPALLPSFPGAHAVRETLAYGVKVSGCSVHLVDSGVDTGPLLAQGTVPVEPGDDETSLHERIKTVERSLLVGTVAALAVHGCTVTGRKASIP
ncbi:MAG TPA: phosphoribosylglycinamide formyltransferase [Candidatus Angelobacter sp.]|nr:phosphoribosylglycinamide formyltransferase [Candidatus Angelobacter sp.]